MESIITYEHKALRYDDKSNFTQKHWETLTAFHGQGTNGDFYDLIHKGVKFKSYVGVLRVGKLTIEILPKLDDNTDDDFWRDRLLDMLKVVTELSSHYPSTAHLRTRPKDILHYYLHLLAGELEELLRGGLTKAYHPRHGNRTALRGRLLIGKHLTENLLHRERFYVADSTYDRLHPLNQLLRQALNLARRLATTPDLQNRLAELNLRFPKLPELRITPGLFDRLRYDRRTEAYRPAVGIARLLLLNFHPDLRSGRHDVLALLFNMNQLWEGFLRHSLRRYLPEGYTVSKSNKATYWTGSGPLRGAVLKPDITIQREGKLVAILDAKWKRHVRPGASDLQQLFTYSRHFAERGGLEHLERVALVYPGEGAGGGARVQGRFAKGGQCDMLWIGVGGGSVQRWMKGVAERVGGWLG